MQDLTFDTTLDKVKEFVNNDLTIVVELRGCHDTTYFKMGYTTEIIAILILMSKRSHEASNCSCQPVLKFKVYKTEEINKYEDLEDLDLFGKFLWSFNGKEKIYNF